MGNLKKHIIETHPMKINPEEGQLTLDNHVLKTTKKDWKENYKV